MITQEFITCYHEYVSLIDFNDNSNRWFFMFFSFYWKIHFQKIKQIRAPLNLYKYCSRIPSKAIYFNGIIWNSYFYFMWFSIINELANWLYLCWFFCVDVYEACLCHCYFISLKSNLRHQIKYKVYPVFRLDLNFKEFEIP